jgi:hypothetical protein
VEGDAFDRALQMLGWSPFQPLIRVAHPP